MFIETLFTQPIYFFRIIIIVIFSITLHELAHGWAAMSQGDNTPQKNWSSHPQPCSSHGQGIDYLSLSHGYSLGTNAHQPF